MADLILRERSERSLRDFYYVLFRHKRKVVWFFCGVLALVSLVTFIMPETYESEAKLLVRLGRESVVLDPTATTTGQVVSVNARRESEIKSELEILQSRDLAEKVVDALGPEAFSGFLSSLDFFGSDDPAKKRDAAVRKLMKNWTITADKDSNIINIAYDGKDPKVAQAVLAKLIAAYMEKHMAVNRTPGSHEFFTEQADKMRAKLAEAEKDLEATKNQTGLSSILDQKKNLLDRIGGMERDLAQTEIDLNASRDRVKAMHGLLKTTPENIVLANTAGYPNMAFDGMRQELYKLQLQEQALLSKYTEKNFLVQETRRQIENAQTMLSKETRSKNQLTTGVNVNHQQLKLAMVTEEAGMSALQAKAQSLTMHLASARDELKTFNENEIQVARLQREVDIQDANYRKYKDKLEQARIDNAMENQKISNISVAQAATYPLKPISPKKGLNLALGFMLGTFGAIGLAFGAERADHSFRRPEDVEKRLQVPVLASIPLMTENGAAPKPGKPKLPLLMPDTKISCGLMGEAGENYETLCDRLLQSEAAPRVIGVTSCRSGEGVSSVAANVALALARKGNVRVLLVEANPLRPSAHRAFGINCSPGLTDLVLDGETNITCARSHQNGNLDVIPSGQGGISLSQLSESKEFAELLTLWKNEYSFVVFDLPAIFKTGGTLRLAGLVEGMILVVGAEGVNWEVARRAKAELEKANVDVLGVVLNKRCFHIPEWLYRTL